MDPARTTLRSRPAALVGQCMVPTALSNLSRQRPPVVYRRSNGALASWRSFPGPRKASQVSAGILVTHKLLTMRCRVKGNHLERYPSLNGGSIGCLAVAPTQRFDYLPVTLGSSTNLLVIRTRTEATPTSSVLTVPRPVCRQRNQNGTAV